MAHLIDKDPIVAEIEKSIERAKAERVLYPKTILAAKNYLLIEDYNKLLSFVNTLEVKDVDVEKEYKDFIKNSDNGRSMFETAQYFFELGLKAKQS